MIRISATKSTVINNFLFSTQVPYYRQTCNFFIFISMRVEQKKIQSQLQIVGLKNHRYLDLIALFDRSLQEGVVRVLGRQPLLRGNQLSSPLADPLFGSRRLKKVTLLLNCGRHFVPVQSRC